MQVLVWVVGIAVIGFAGWWALKLVAAYAVPAEKSGLLFLKQELRQRSVDVTRIPDAALIKIVAERIKGAQGIAMAEQVLKHRPGDANWRANLVSLLSSEADEISHILKGRAPSDAFLANDILIEYKVIEPRQRLADDLTHEQLVNAARHAVSYAELGERLNREAAARKANPQHGSRSTE